MFTILSRAAGILGLAFSAGCASMPPMKTVARVDIPRFMGDWYLVGHIPASQEKNAWNGIETYRLAEGTTDVVETTFAFREGSFEGELVTLRPTGKVEGDDGARWGMKFYWRQGPFRFEYLVIHLDREYTQTVIGRSARDYVWIMARTSTVADADWDRLVGVVRDSGYDVSKLRRVPQRWGVPPDVTPAVRAPGRPDWPIHRCRIHIVN